MLGNKNDEEEHVRNEGRGQQLGTSLARAHQEVGFSGLSSKNLFHHKRTACRVQHTVTTFSQTNKKLMKFEKKAECASNQREDHRPWITEEHQDVEQEIALGKTRNRVST